MVVDLRIIFALCTVLYCGTTECFDVLIHGFHICVNHWKLAFKNELGGAASVMGRLLMLLYFNKKWASMELKNAR